MKQATARRWDETETAFQVFDCHWLSRAAIENAAFRASFSARSSARSEGLETFADGKIPKQVFEGIAKLIGTMNELQTEVNQLRTRSSK